MKCRSKELQAGHLLIKISVLTSSANLSEVLVVHALDREHGRTYPAKAPPSKICNHMYDLESLNHVPT